MDFLLKGAEYFIWHPGRAFKVSLIFWCLLLISLALRRRVPGVRTWPPLVAALGWVLFGLHEYVAYLERANIRIDLLITWPALWLLTIACCVVWLYGLLFGSPRPTPPGGD